MSKITVARVETANNSTDLTLQAGSTGASIVLGGGGGITFSDAVSNAQTAADAAHGKFFLVPEDQTVYVDVPSQKATIDEALTAIARWIPTPTSSIIIRIAAGTYTRDMSLTTAGNGEIVVNHPFGNRVSIRSADAYVSLTYSSLGTIVSNSAGNHSVPITVSSAANVSVGDWIRVSATTGTGDHYNIRGFWEVTAKSSNTITLKVTDQRASWNATTVATMTLAKVPVVFKFTNPSGTEFYGIDIRTRLGDAGGIGSALNAFSAIGLVGPATGSANSGMRISYNGYLYSASGSINIANFGRNGVWAFGNSFCYLDQAAVTNCGTSGFNFVEGSIGQLIRSIANGCGGNGFTATTGASMSASQTVACGNNRGYDSADRGGGINAGSSFVWGNSVGFRCQQGGHGSLASATLGYNTTGCRIEVTGGRLNVASITNTSNTTDYTLPLNVLVGDALIYNATGTSTKILTTTGALDFDSIAANSTAELTISLDGATAGCAVAVGFTSAFNAGLIVTGYCAAADTITVRVANVTTSAINPTARTVRVTAIVG